MFSNYLRKRKSAPPPVVPLCDSFGCTFPAEYEGCIQIIGPTRITGKLCAIHAVERGMLGTVDWHMRKDVRRLA